MASTVWRGFITFGLISIPVRLFRAARSERVSLRNVRRAPVPELRGLERRNIAGPPPPLLPSVAEPEPEPPAKPTAQADSSRTGIKEAPYEPEPMLEPVQSASVRKGTDELVPSESVIKGYEYAKSRFVPLEREELKSIAAKTSTEMEIAEFVKLAEIDPVYFETSYYVRPEAPGERAYALLYEAFRKTGLVAVGQFAMHGRDHVLVLRPGSRGIIGHTLYFSSEVRAEDEYPADAGSVKKNELELSEKLIHSLAAPFEPGKYKDTYRERLEAMIAAKVEGRSQPAPAKQAEPKPVVDIAEALRKSLAGLKKPAVSEKQPASSPRQSSTAKTKKASGGRGAK